MDQKWYYPGQLPRAAHESTLEEFVEAVRRVDESPELMAQFRGEPLLLTRPGLAPVIAFLRDAAKAITGRDLG